MTIIATRRNRVVDHQGRIRLHLVKGRFEQEGERTAVDAGAIGPAHIHRSDLRIHFDWIGQLAQLAIDNGTYNRGVTPFR